MAPRSAESRPDIRRYVTLFVAQLVLMAAAILASRTDLGRVSSALVMLAAGTDAAVVAIGLMGARLAGRSISALVRLSVFFMAALLFWPAWDVDERAPGF